MWNPIYDRNDLTYQTEGVRRRKQTYRYQRGKGIGDFGISRYKTVYSTENYIQYPLINHSGRETKTRMFTESRRQ